MKSVFVVLAAFAASVVAQIEGIPSCAMECVSPMLTQKVGNCESGNMPCICRNTDVIKQVGECLKVKCSDEDTKKTITVAYDLCSSVGVTIPTTLPAAASTSVSATVTGTGTITYTPTATATSHRNITNTTGTITSPTTTSTGAAATGYVANGLGVAGAAIAAFLFL